MKFPPSFLDEIRARLPVSRVVSRQVTLKKRGREFVGLSPFNREKTPSFTVNDQKGFYHCFSSGKNGDIFTFVMETEGLSFPEAVERLAQDAGVPMPAPDPDAERREAKRASLYEVLELATAFFEDRLQGADGATARGYLADRGIEPAVQATFRLGYAPGQKHELKQYLASRDVAPDQMIAAGLVIAGDDIPVAYDRFRDRIIFPIHDLRGRVIAFGGRALDEGAPAKYLNSPETELFHKGSVLYNLPRAREAAHKAGQIVAVEGYTDVIALVAAGFGFATAPLGTALTDRQIQLLWRMAAEPVLCFDGDRAGRTAAFRAVDTALPLLKPGFSLKFALLPDGRDPDDVLRSEGVAAMEAVFQSAVPLVDMLWSREVENKDWSTPERRAGLESRIDAVIAEIADTRVKRHYEQALRERLNRLWRGEQAWKKRGAARSPSSLAGYRWEGARTQPKRQRDRLTSSLRASALARGQWGSRRELLLLWAVINHPALLAQYSEEFSTVEFSTPDLDRLRYEILEIAAQGDTLDKDRLLDELKVGDVSRTVARVFDGLGPHREWFCEAESAEIDAETGWLHVLALHRKSKTLQKELKSAERALALDASEENLNILQDVRAQLETVEGTEAVVQGFGDASDRQTGQEL